MNRTLPLALGALLAACPSDKPPAPTPLSEPVQKGPVEVAETEPNDTSATAQVVKGATRLKASFAAGTKADEDWTKLETPSPAVVRAEVSGVPGLPVVLEVWDADRNLRAKTTTPAGESAIFPNYTCETACFFKVASGKKDGAGDYTLTLATSAPGPRSEREPNDKYVDAQKLAPGGAVDGFLFPEADEDWYLVDTGSLAPDQVLSVSLATPPEVRAQLDVVRASDQALQGSWRSGEVGQDVKVRNLSRPAEGETGWYLVVKSAWIAKGKRGANAKAGYTLEVKPMPGAPDLETEPNDDAARATVIDLAGSTKRTGYLAPKGDSDWYAFTVEQPSILRADVTGVDRVDLQLAVIDPEKRDAEKDNELAKANDGGLKEPEILAGVFVPAGQNFVRVDTAWKKIDEKWVKDYENPDATYALTLELTPDDGTHEREPNDTAQKATPVEIGKEYRGYIHPAKDVDAWQLTVGESSNVSLVVSGVPKLDLSITVKDAAGTMVGTVDKNRVEGEERLVVPFEPGTYTVEIREKGRETNALKPYTLTLK